MTLAEALDLAEKLDSPHVDLGPALGLPSPLRVGVDHLHEVAEGLIAGNGIESLSASLQWDGGALTVAQQDGGVIATLQITF